MGKPDIIKVRNAAFMAANGASLDDAMLGLIMAQGKLVASIVSDPTEARTVVDHYYNLLIDGLPTYCAEHHSEAE